MSQLELAFHAVGTTPLPSLPALPPLHEVDGERIRPTLLLIRRVIHVHARRRGSRQFPRFPPPVISSSLLRGALCNSYTPSSSAARPFSEDARANNGHYSEHGDKDQVRNDTEHAEFFRSGLVGVTGSADIVTRQDAAIQRKAIRPGPRLPQQAYRLHAANSAAEPGIWELPLAPASRSVAHLASSADAGLKPLFARA